MGDLFSGPHIILIALVVLLLFGGKKIPELMRGLGRGIREFKDAKDNVSRGRWKTTSRMTIKSTLLRQVRLRAPLQPNRFHPVLL